MRCRREGNVMIRRLGDIFLAICFISMAVSPSSAIPIKAQARKSEPNYFNLQGSYNGKDAWTDCGEGATELLVQNVTMLPNPVKVGKDFTLNLDLVNGNGPITGGTFKTEVFLVGVPVYSETDNVCDKHPCPLSTGSLTLGITTFMPSATPPGWYQIKITGLDQDGLPSICADIHFTISPWKS